MSTIAERWVRVYTRGLPEELRASRCDEIASDVYEQRASNGLSTRAVRVAIAGRTLRGIPGDVIWRFEEGRAVKQQQRAQLTRPTGLRAAWATATQAWFTPLAVLVGLANVAFAVWVATDPDGKMPGQAVGPVFLLGFAAAMFSGLWLRWRAQFAGSRPSRPEYPTHRRTAGLVLLALVAVVALIFGATVSLPVAVFGVVLLIGVAIAATRGVRSSPRTDTENRLPATGSVALADALLVVGTLPSLALWWLVLPPVLAIVVIAGVIGTGRGTRRTATV